MTRPCFLVVDREFSANISTRKLILETAKFNVITAYSGSEALETADRFPSIDAVVLDTGLHDIDAAELIRRLKKSRPKLPVVLICLPSSHGCDEADHRVDFFDPASLLKLLKQLFPRQSAEIEARNRSLSEEEEKRN